MARCTPDIRGVTPALVLAGFYVHTTKTGRKVAVSRRTYRLLQRSKAAA